MTAQEAIKRLQYERPAREYHSNLNEVFDMAIEALEKQIPKKPDFEGDVYWNGELVYDTWICPCCEERYEVDYEDYDHCPKCGQAIDLKWSEQNE